MENVLNPVYSCSNWQSCNALEFFKLQKRIIPPPFSLGQIIQQALQQQTTVNNNNSEYVLNFETRPRAIAFAMLLNRGFFDP